MIPPGPVAWHWHGGTALRAAEGLGHVEVQRCSKNKKRGTIEDRPAKTHFFVHRVDKSGLGYTLCSASTVVSYFSGSSWWTKRIGAHDA